MKGNFQIIVIIVFMAAAVFGILVFSGAIPIGSQTNKTGGGGTVVLWGTVSANTMGPLIENFNIANPTYVVKYVQKSEDTFDRDLLKALAAGNGPDLFLLPDDLALSYSDKIFTVPYASYPISTFNNTFATAGHVFLTSRGMLAFPLSIDPLVMYYNRTMLDSGGVVYAPQTWDQLQALVPTLNKKGDLNQLTKSTVALGLFSNIAHAKDILSALFMQIGDPIITEKNGSFISVLEDPNARYNASTVLQFYTDFADSSKSVYSWNRSLPNSADAFSAENLAFYFGYASELQTLVNKNPNENFLVAPFPQIKGTNSKLTFARVTGIAISPSSKNFNSAFSVASLMSGASFAKSFADAFGVAPARRDLLANTPNDAYSPTFYSSALFSRSWLDPSPASTDSIWSGMIDKVLSNALSPEDSVKDANGKLQLLLVQ